MSTALPWIVGAAILMVVGVLAAIAGRRTSSPVTVDRARSRLSELELAFDRTGSEVPADSLAEARRLQLLAGAALAGHPDADDARRSVDFSTRALAILISPRD